MSGIIDARFEGSAQFAEHVWFDLLKKEEVRQLLYENSRDFFAKLQGMLERGELDGATFMPHVSSDGWMTWTNNKELENPQPRNIRGLDGNCYPVDGYFCLRVEGDDLYVYYEDGDTPPDLTIERGNLILTIPD